MSKQPHFSPGFFKFLKDLRKHNDRDWFAKNKPRFEAVVRDPFLRFIADFGPLLHGISLNFAADPRPTGGSLLRIYRDVRFSPDKSPYKTHMAASFRHVDEGDDRPAPGFYLHLEPGTCFAGGGLWHSDIKTLTRVRRAIVDRPREWEAVRRRKIVSEGGTLSRAPKGFDPNHRFVEDLRRTDFVGGTSFTQSQVCSAKFLKDFAAACRKMSPLMAFLTEAVGLDY